ncbi:hemerythrin domain-containing protein [Pseudomonas tohonis]|uniref:hemerythrin domain-containing protein n=1 Tax=Pseudomonas tohonis TaxID=2725477 RepID=UPI001F35B9E7|nr:hemerythrin domain-containing protein [Pseudomonas tohonis]
MNAIELLKQDHVTVKVLLEQLKNTTERGVKTRTELLRRIEIELLIHTTIEEQIFYPAFKAAGEKDESVMWAEAKEEHRTVDSLVLPDLKQTPPSSLEFAGRAKVLKELVEHHIEEEEKEMFPKASKLLGKQKLAELGAEMEALKKSMKQELHSNAA